MNLVLGLIVINPTIKINKINLKIVLNIKKYYGLNTVQRGGKDISYLKMKKYQKKIKDIIGLKS